jgi:hypothetical protein
LTRKKIAGIVEIITKIIGASYRKNLSKPVLLDEKRGRPIDIRRVLNASQSASQPIPHALSLNYNDLFKIQRVRNVFPLSPVSYSKLASYLECPWCTVVQKPKRRAKEPTHFLPIQQGRLFGGAQPDPRLVGTLLHTLVNLLHAPDSPLTEKMRIELLADSDAFVHFLRCDALETLQKAGKIKLAMFFNELSQQPTLFRTTMITPMLHYQRELISTHSTVFAAAERFQLKLLSTKNTFADHPDRGGHIALVGEFDQIRMRALGDKKQVGNIPAIIEFKKGLGGGKKGSAPQPSLFEEAAEQAEDSETVLPSDAHAMQLMIYWLAFQTRWDLAETLKETRGMWKEIPMQIQQELELILYNLNDGCQYQLRPTSHKDAMMALIECIFYLDWALKSGYAAPSPEHECQRSPLTEVPPDSIQVQIGYAALSAQECHQLAREAFGRFKETIRWERYIVK